jgi:hypothetical protein
MKSSIRRAYFVSIEGRLLIIRKKKKRKPMKVSEKNLQKKLTNFFVSEILIFLLRKKLLFLGKIKYA